VEFTDKLEFRDSCADGAMPIYRCIDGEGKFVKEGDGPRFSKEIAQKIYKEMTKLNTMDKILYESQRQGRISFYMTNYGEEV
jgi:2-oxoisovalerate dehydrogenase E1 component alpha subunit